MTLAESIEEKEQGTEVKGKGGTLVGRGFSTTKLEDISKDSQDDNGTFTHINWDEDPGLLHSGS